MRFEHTLSVRFSDCDMYGHVNNATYLTYMECARVQLLRDIEMPLEELMGSGRFLIIVGVDIRYRGQARMGDALTVRTTPSKMGRTGGTFLQEIYRDRELLTSADVKWVCVDEAARPIRLPQKLRLLD